MPYLGLDQYPDTVPYDAGTLWQLILVGDARASGLMVRPCVLHLRFAGQVVSVPYQRIKSSQGFLGARSQEPDGFLMTRDPDAAAPRAAWPSPWVLNGGILAGGKGA